MMVMSLSLPCIHTVHPWWAAPIQTVQSWHCGRWTEQYTGWYAFWKRCIHCPGQQLLTLTTWSASCTYVCTANAMNGTLTQMNDEMSSVTRTSVLVVIPISDLCVRSAYAVLLCRQLKTEPSVYLKVHGLFGLWS